MNNPKHWFSIAYGIQSEYFILGDPRISGGAYVFILNTSSGTVSHGPMLGVFDDFTRVRTIPKWVREPMIDALLLKDGPPRIPPELRPSQPTRQVEGFHYKWYDEVDGACPARWVPVKDSVTETKQ